MANNQITKIYELRSLGTDALLKELDTINTRFAAIKKTVQELKSQKTQTLIADPAEIAALNDQLRQLAIEEAALKVRRAELQVQAKQMQVLRAQELADQRATAAGNKVAAGSYNALKAEIKTLYDLVKAAPKGADIITTSGLVSYDEAIQKLKSLTAAEQEFRRQFQKDGTLVGEYTTGIIQAFQRMGLGDILKAQLDTAKGAIKSLDDQFEILRLELERVRATGQGSLQDIERQLIENRRAAGGLESQLHEMTDAMRSAGVIGGQVSASLQEGFRNIRGQITQVVLGYVGFQALLSGMQQGVEITKELSDQTTNLEIELDKTAGGAAKLVDGLAALNTRTKLPVLEEIANIAARAGTSEENLLGVAEAIDKIKVAFGKDFGDVEEGTEALVKIINIYEGGNVTGDGLLRVGNAIRSLANESVASVPFLNDFTKRMAGLKGSFDIALPSVLGMASGFENFGQSAEVSSTALVAIIPKLAADVDKFAGIVGITREQFSELINNNPAEAFLRVSQALVQTKGGVEEFSQAFKDSELGSGRVSSIIGVAGKNADEFRSKIALAGDSIQRTDNITTAFNAKNSNLAATLDKISKSFADAANSRAFQITLTAIAGILTLVINNLGIIIGVLGTYGAILAIANAAQIRLWVSTQASTIAFRAQYAALVIADTFTKAYTVTLNLLTGATNRSTAAATLLRIALSALGIGALIVLVAALAGAFNTAAAAVTGHMDILRAQQQVMNEAMRQTAEARSRLDFYANVVKNTALAEDVRRKAMEELIKINPRFQDALTGNTINMQAFGKALRDVNDDLIKNAALQAAQANVSQANNEAIRLQQLRQKMQFQASQPGGIRPSDLTDEEREMLNVSLRTYGRALVNARFDQFDLAELYADLDKRINQAATKAQAFSKVAEAKFIELNKGTAGAAEKTLAERAETERLNAIELKKLIDGLDDQIALLREGDPKIRELQALQATYQARLDAINNKQSSATTRGSRLGGEIQDQFKDIEAKQKADLTALETRFNKGLILERDYLLELQKINDEANRAKIAKLDGSNAAERQKRADLQLQIIKDQKGTNEKLFQIDLEAYNAIKDQADRRAREAANVVLDDPAATDPDKAEAQQTLFSTLLANQLDYNEDVDALEKKFNQVSVKNAQDRADAITEINKNLGKAGLELQNDLTKQALADLNATYDANAQAIRDRIIKRAEEIFSSGAKASEKRRQLSQLQNQGEQELLQNNIDRIDAELAANLRLYQTKVINEQEYQKRDKELREQRFKDVVALNDRELSEEQKKQQLKRQMMDAAFQIAGTFFAAQFEIQNQQIDKNFDEAKAYREAEKEKRLAQATSQAEKEAIEKEYADKEREADRQRNIERQEVAKKQLAIEFALASIKAISTSTNIYEGLIKEAIVIAEYYTKLQLLNAQKFAGGGKVQPLGPGRIAAPANIPTQPNGDNMLATVRVGEVILNERQQRMAGGPAFFKALGVPGFATGGYFGAQLTPPVFASQVMRPGTAGVDLQPLVDMNSSTMAAVVALSRQVNTLQVVLNPNAVTIAQNNTAKAVDVATL